MITEHRSAFSMKIFLLQLVSLSCLCRAFNNPLGVKPRATRNSVALSQFVVSGGPIKEYGTGYYVDRGSPWRNREQADFPIRNRPAYSGRRTYYNDARNDMRRPFYYSDDVYSRRRYNDSIRSNGGFGINYGTSYPAHNYVPLDRQYGNNRRPYNRRYVNNYSPYNRRYVNNYGPYNRRYPDSYGPYNRRYVGNYGPYNRRYVGSYGPYNRRYVGNYGPYNRRDVKNYVTYNRRYVDNRGPYSLSYGDEYGTFNRRYGDRYGPYNRRYSYNHGPYNRRYSYSY